MIELYKLTQEYDEVKAMLNDPDVPTEAVIDTLDAIAGEIDSKVENCACLMKDLLSEAEAIDREIKALEERKKHKLTTAESIKEYVGKSLIAVGKEKVETARCKVTFRTSTALAISDEVEFTEWCKTNNTDFLNYKEPTIYKKAVSDAIKGGTVIPYCILETKKNVQVK